MEWCLKEPSQLTVLEIERVDVDDAGSEAAPLLRLEAARKTPLRMRYECPACGAAANHAWRACAECNAPMPLEAIGVQLNLAQRELSASADARQVASAYTPARTSYRIGAMSGWAVGLDDAEAGADHPPAFGLTSMMLPAAPQRKVFVDRNALFHQGLDRIQRQADEDGRRMPPPPPRRKRGYFDDDDRRMPDKRSRVRDEESDDGRSEHSLPPSECSYYSTAHSRARTAQRAIVRADIKEAIAHGERRAGGGGRYTYQYAGLTVITDLTSRYVITAFRGPPSKPVYLLDEADGSWFDLESAYAEDAPPTPSARGSTPRSQSRGRSESTSLSAVATAPGLGTIREWRRMDEGDMLETWKLKARLANDFALEARATGLYWVCADCDAMDNILWYRCLGCGAHCPAAAVALAKEDARRVLSQAQTLGVAEKDNPFRAGVLGLSLIHI